MAEKKIKSAPAIYEARADFYINGSQLVLQGHTVEAGHPILKGRQHLFRPFVPTYALPDAEAEPETAEPETGEAPDGAQ